MEASPIPILVGFAKVKRTDGLNECPYPHLTMPGPGICGTHPPTVHIPARRPRVATNKNKHDGHLEGAVQKRSQFQTPAGNWAKRDAGTGRIIDVKKGGDPFKGVRKEK